MFGGPRPDLARARVLEIGCGDGATLLPIAAFEPTWTVLGIDSSRSAIAKAVALAEAARIANARFVCDDLAKADIESEAWDIVIAHGVYSWIDPRRRAALRRLIRRALAPNGLAYVSFNALPGWSVRGVVRDLIRRNPDPQAEALEVLDRLAPYTTNDPWGQLLAQEFRRARDADDFYFIHEYCSPHNDAFWLGDFVRAAARDGLRWIGDSQFDLSAGRPYEQTRIALGVAGVRGEELADTVGYRQFRCAVLARDDAERHAPLDDDAVVGVAIISGRVVLGGEPVELATAREQTFQSADESEIKVVEPLCKAALIVLERIDPDGLPFDELIRAARELLRSEGGVEISARAEREVREGVARLWRVGALHLRNHRARLSVDQPRRPKILEFTKHEAIHWQYVTNALGAPMAIEAHDLIVMSLMDGARTEDDLFDEFINWPGMGDRGDPNFLAAAKEYIGASVSKFARWGFLERPTDTPPSNDTASGQE